LFVDDALIFDQIQSQSVRYAAERGPWVAIFLGRLNLVKTYRSVLLHRTMVWLCDPNDLRWRVQQQSGLMRIAPGAEELLSYSIQVGTTAS
jgi:hypothetical protein